MFARSFLIACALCLMPVAHAQNVQPQTPEQKAAVDDLMQQIIYEADDRQIATGVKTGLLNAKQAALLDPITIDASKDHFLLGTCSDACFELQLEVVDENGVALPQVVEDNEDISQIYDFPILHVKAGRTGSTLRVKATMAHCEDEPCIWGVGVFITDEYQH